VFSNMLFQAVARLSHLEFREA